MNVPPAVEAKKVMDSDPVHPRPGSGISEVGINAALAQIEALAPQNEVEAALARTLPPPRFSPGLEVAV
jgi:hypothetical protein